MRNRCCEVPLESNSGLKWKPSLALVALDRATPKQIGIRKWYSTVRSDVFQGILLDDVANDPHRTRMLKPRSRIAKMASVLANAVCRSPAAWNRSRVSFTSTWLRTIVTAHSRP